MCSFYDGIWYQTKKGPCHRIQRSNSFCLLRKERGQTAEQCTQKVPSYGMWPEYWSRQKYYCNSGNRQWWHRQTRRWHVFLHHKRPFDHERNYVWGLISCSDGKSTEGAVFWSLELTNRCVCFLSISFHKWIVLAVFLLYCYFFC